MKRYYYLLLTIIIIFSIYRLANINYTLTDEPVYALMGRAITQGHLPYQDFYFAHPPLFLLLTPFTQSLISLKIGLLIIQSLIILLFFKLSLQERSWTNSLLLVIALIISPSFNHVFNLYLGFGLLTFWLLLSDYYFKKNRLNQSVIALGIACLTRLFGAYFCVARAVIKRHYKTLLALLPLLLLIAFYRPFMEQAVIYHALKQPMKLVKRLKVVKTIIYNLLPILILLGIDWFSNHRRQTNIDYVLIAGGLVGGVLMQKVIFPMYGSIILPWLLLAYKPDRTWPYLLLVVLMLMVSINYELIVTEQEIVSREELALLSESLDHSIPLTGQFNSVALLKFYDDSFTILGSESEPAGYIDLCYARLAFHPFFLDEYLAQLDQSLYVFCNSEVVGYSTCDLFGDLEFVRYYGGRKDLVVYQNLYK